MVVGGAGSALFLGSIPSHTRITRRSNCARDLWGRTICRMPIHVTSATAKGKATTTIVTKTRITWSIASSPSNPVGALGMERDDGRSESLGNVHTASLGPVPRVDLYGRGLGGPHALVLWNAVRYGDDRRSGGCLGGDSVARPPPCCPMPSATWIICLSVRVGASCGCTIFAMPRQITRVTAKGSDTTTIVIRILNSSSMCRLSFGAGGHCLPRRPS